jgi:hypothetical protein
MGDPMKITTMTFYITDEDFNQYAKALKKLEWEQPRKHILRKTFGNTSVEIREHIRAFSTNLEMEVTFYNPNGCSIEVISLMLAELKQVADQLADDQADEAE